MKKYKLTEETKEYYGITLYRIEALKDFGTVKAGDKGGFIRSEDNLAHEGNAWVYGNARDYGYARVDGYARVSGNARVDGYARVYGYARVGGYAHVYGSAWVGGYAHVDGSAHVDGNADIMQIGPIGSRDDITTFFKNQENGISVRCGCFYGRLEEFEEAVQKTHGGTKYEKEYMAAIAAARAHIEGGE